MTFSQLSIELWEVACFDRTMESYQFPAERRAVMVYIYAAKVQTVDSSHVLQIILLRNIRVPWSLLPYKALIMWVQPFSFLLLSTNTVLDHGNFARQLEWARLRRCLCSVFYTIV